MATSITLHSKREVTGGQYKVTDTVTAASPLTKKLFVFRQTDDVYVRVAELTDLYDYPEVSTPAIAYYRKDAVVLLFTMDQLDEAAAVKPAHVERLTALAQEYEDAADAFIGEEDTAISIP